MNNAPLNILFLCTHNAARSIMAEAVLNHMGGERFKAYSAGSNPRVDQRPHPLGLEVLAHAGIRTEGLTSKSWNVFVGSDAPHMDLIITVCDHAAGEPCPVWPGHPATAHWSFPDPSEGEASDAVKRMAFRHTLFELHQRMELLLALSDDKLHHTMLQDTVRRLAQGV